MTPIGATAWLGMAVRSARDTETAGNDVEKDGRNTMRGRKVATLVISTLIAVGATLMLVNANGNITAYIVGGAIPRPDALRHRQRHGELEEGLLKLKR
ncbi:hypothetical protein [Micromonospora radicis]|uniref:hypothetical protein n=1 Tax=Micromonospora radicis TaxID=1894971 RepID=UPI0011C3DBEB|nr:hypothetical protein [Micromonospora radicis]